MLSIFCRNLVRHARVILLKYTEVYDDNYSRHLFPIRFAQKSGWTFISLDCYYPLPFQSAPMNIANPTHVEHCWMEKIINSLERTSKVKKQIIRGFREN